MKSMLNVVNKYYYPHRYKTYFKKYKDKEFNYLDVGCGVVSPFKTKIIFPKCKYYGIDINKDSITPECLDLMEKFYHLDLNTARFDEIQDDFFNVITISHVIEHLKIGIKIIDLLVPKLKKGGQIYIEFPSVKSLSLPSKVGTLHFCDDPTHIYLPSLRKIANLLLRNNFRIIKGGTRRDKKRILLFPVYYLADKFYYNHGTAGSFWDLCGFAEYIAAEKL